MTIIIFIYDAKYYLILDKVSIPAIFLALIFASSMIFLTIWEIPAPKKKIEVILQEQDFLQ